MRILWQRVSTVADVFAAFVSRDVVLIERRDVATVNDRKKPAEWHNLPDHADRIVVIRGVIESLGHEDGSGTSFNLRVRTDEGAKRGEAPYDVYFKAAPKLPSKKEEE